MAVNKTAVLIEIEFEWIADHKKEKQHSADCIYQ